MIIALLCLFAVGATAVAAAAAAGGCLCLMVLGVLAVVVLVTARGVLRRYRQWRGKRSPLLAQSDGRAGMSMPRAIHDAGAVVVVGGDFARSPRMQYHAVSLAQHFRWIGCVGLDFGNKVAESLRNVDSIPPSVGEPKVVYALQSAPVVPHCMRRNWILSTAYRIGAFVISFAGALTSELHRQRRSGPAGANSQTACVTHVLVQSPPAAPFLHLVLAVAFFENFFYRFLWQHGLRGREWPPLVVVVDVHNYGFTLLAIDKRPAWIVSVYHLLERWAVRRCDAMLTVSHVMKDALVSSPEGIKQRRAASAAMTSLDPRCGFSLSPRSRVTVLHDAAPDFYAPCERSILFKDVLAAERELRAPPWYHMNGRDAAGGCQEARDAPPLVIVSSTSWTADDDYSLVVQALTIVQSAIVAAKDSPTPLRRVWLIVTGKGVTRSVFEQQVEAARFDPQLIHVSTAYLQSFNNYARVLGAADVGLCVHRSSSGLDLPMKCVDMLGCGIPVIALDYPALAELIHSESGWTFTDAASLAPILVNLLQCRPVVMADSASAQNELTTKRHYVRSHRQQWTSNWERSAAPVLGCGKE